MPRDPAKQPKALIIWSAFLALVLGPVILSLMSPLLAWRQPIYIIGGVAGVLGLVLLLIQPILAAGYLPGLSVRMGRRIHPFTGALLILAVLLHVVGLWITSPPDMVDALLFRSPTPFSAWGVIAMWALFAAALLALLRSRLRPRLWRLGHGALVLNAVAGALVHALLIEGTMETLSKIALCAAALLVTLKALSTMKIRPKARHREGR